MAKGRREQVGRVKFLLDECLSHTYVADFVARGYPDVVHPIHVGLRRLRDDLLLKKAIAEDRIVVSANVKDFRKWLALSSIHPGAILLEGGARAETLQLIFLGIAFAEARSDPGLYMINRVIEVSRAGGVVPYVMPAL